MLSTSGGCCKAPDFRNPYRPFHGKGCFCFYGNRSCVTFLLSQTTHWKRFPGVMFRYFPVDPWAWRGSNCRVHLSIGLHKGWAIEGAVRCPKGLGGKLYQKTGEHHNWRRESMKLTISARGWTWEWCLCGLAAFFDHCPVEDFWTSKFHQWFVAGNWGW